MVNPETHATLSTIKGSHTKQKHNTATTNMTNSDQNNHDVNPEAREA